MIGYRSDQDHERIALNKRLRAMHPEIISRTEAVIADVGGSVARDPKSDLLTINDELVVSLVLARCQPQRNGSLRWRIRFDPMRYQADVTLAVRLDPENRDELDYYLLPWLDLPRQEIRLCNSTSIAFEAFRFDSLSFFYGMAERVGVRRKWGEEQIIDENIEDKT